jgi:nucleoid-associated protein YgaU
MVPLRLDVCDDRSRSVGVRSRPQLVLKDLTAERPSQNPSAPSRSSSFHRLENILLAAAAAAALLYFFFTFTLSLVHSVQQSYATPALPSVVVISKTVVRGDTLTKLARRYGDPSTYILAREEQIARANHLAGTAPLVPGQHLRIPVTNPAVISQIEHRYHRSLVAQR